MHVFHSVKSGLQRTSRRPLASHHSPVVVALVYAIPLLWILLLKPPFALGQLPKIPGLQESAAEEYDDLSLVYKKRVVKQLKDLSAALRAEQWNDARDLLTVLRAEDPLLMTPDPRGTFVPLHRDLALRVQNPGREILKDFQQENAAAENALRQTLANDSYAGLIPFLQKYAGTKAAFHAHFLLASVHADRGHSLAARFWLAPLLTENADPELKAAAEKMMARLANQKAVARTSPAPLSNDQPTSGESAVTQPQQEQPADGAASPAVTASTVTASTVTASTATTSPVNGTSPDSIEELNPNSAETLPTDVEIHQFVQWMQSLPLSVGAAKKSQELVQSAAEFGILPWTAWEPEIDERHIYIRTPLLLSAYNRQSGRHVWTRTILQPRVLIEESDEDFPLFPMRMDDNAINTALNSPEIQLTHRNEIVGRMTSDSERLFAVCQSGEAATPAPRDDNFRMRAILGQGETAPIGLWELIAIEKSTGRRLWTTGGPPVEEKFGNELAMAWFAGPPAVLGQELFQIVERNGSIQLACLKASTGQIRWLLPLVYPAIDISLDPARQLMAAQIRAEAGIVFTTTSTGWIFAIDALTHSPLWTRRLPTAPRTEQPGRSFRNPTFLQTPLQPMGKAWRSEPPLLSADALVVASSESHQLLVLDPLNGKVRLKSSDLTARKSDAAKKLPRSLDFSDNATTIVYADSEMLVASSATSLVGIRLPGLEKFWTLDRDSAINVPVGPGARSGSSLLLPLSDGSIDVIALTDGRRTDNLKGVRPRFHTGGLYACGENIVSYSPGHIALLATKPADRPDESDPLQEARFLLEAGRLNEAKDALGNVTLHALNAEPARRIRFRIALGSFLLIDATEPAALEEVLSLAATPSERAIVQYLRLDLLIRTSPENVVPMLLRVLQDDDVVQQVEIPDGDNLKKILQSTTSENPLELSSLTTNSEQLRYPFRSWLLQQLREQLRNADETRRLEIVKSMASLKDVDVLEMQSPELTEEYLRRVEDRLAQSLLNETTLHLLSAAATSKGPAFAEPLQAATPASDRISAAFDRAAAIVDSAFAEDRSQRMVMQRLLQVIRHELQVAVDQQPPALPENVRDSLADRWQNSPDQPLKMLPVSTTGQMAYRTPGIVSVDAAFASDRFLSAFDWSCRRTPGAVLAQSIEEPALPAWSLKIRGNENPFSQTEEELYRFGSVLVLQNLTGLSAFSVADGRWLWTRTMPGIISRRSNLQMQRGFKDYHSGIDGAFSGGFGRRICGGGQRWICLWTEGTLEVVDSLTGRRLWAASGLNMTSSVFVCRDLIFIRRHEDDVVLVHAMTGLPVASALIDHSSETLRKVMQGTSEGLVIWNSPSAQNAERTVQWVDPVTGDILRTVTLTGMTLAQFLDAETLVAFTKDRSFHTVNLLTGDTSLLSFSMESESTAAELPTDQLAIAADPVNYYIFERQENAMFMGGALYGIRAQTFRKEMRAVNRRTGKIAWIHPAEDAGLACIDGTESVMLFLTVSQKPRANAAAIPGLAMQTGQRYSIEGVSRVTGTRMFSYSVVAQIPVPTLRLSKNAAGQLDLEAFGNRVRFLPEPPAVAP
jgi:outer membrane protein assembly factor BamB